jgi:hypothetical protein
VSGVLSLQEVRIHHVRRALWRLTGFRSIVRRSTEWDRLADESRVRREQHLAVYGIAEGAAALLQKSAVPGGASP